MMLSVEHLRAFHGRAQILHDLTFSLAEGEAAVLLGRNGAGKSTTLKALMGLLRPASGRIVLDGTDVAGLPPFRLARLGLGYVPEERRIFPELTVMENLEVGRRPGRTGAAPWTPERLFGLFPNLAAMPGRLGGRMSGGEQQMLAIARTLMGNPRIILLDEPSEGLAPVIVDGLVAALGVLKRSGVTMLIAEQNPSFARRIAERALVIERGRLVWEGGVAALLAEDEIRRRYLAL